MKNLILLFVCCAAQNYCMEAPLKKDVPKQLAKDYINKYLPDHSEIKRIHNNTFSIFGYKNSVRKECDFIENFLQRIALGKNSKEFVIMAAETLAIGNRISRISQAVSIILAHEDRVAYVYELTELCKIAVELDKKRRKKQN